MPAPPIQLFLTTIITQPTLKRRQEYILRILQTHKIPFTSYDLASDDAAKTLWKRRAPIGKQELPGILIGGQYPGSFTEFEEAVEFDELKIFLRRDEEWDEKLADPRTQLPAVPIGVPGAYLPSEMTPKKPSAPSTSTQTSSPPEKKPDSRKDTGSEDQLQDIKASEEELADLVKELGLDNENADGLIKGLTQTQAQTESTESDVKKSPSPI